ncbi:DUF1329 domain-containing protein [Zooshikella sp. RANM57]|uniref:DUF1329 domain-containing protein n=1 Tax=Zooshikella sp. RANM57 TaxID=3425863 RepID=UPI003D6F1356
MKKNIIYIGAAVAALTLAIQTATAAISPQEAKKLGTTLTPIGAEKAGNADGTIPAWTGGITKKDIPASYKRRGQHYPNPWSGDKPKFYITAENLAKYKSKLTAGQIALFEAYPDSFKMPVYQTRRSGSLPQHVYDDTIKNATTAELVNGGNGFKGAYASVPFPMPKTGLEALWNHIVRYRGEYVVRRASEVAVQRNGDYTLITAQQEAGFNFYYPKGSESSLDNTIIYYLSFTTSPARLAGEAVLVHETLDQVKQPRQAWKYNAGQRRVRRAPNLAYDTPISSADGLRTADDTDMFNGAPNRYEWKLLGKKEIYIPYNNYNLISPNLKYENVLAKGHINPEHTRYELHRVWVVEGTLKKDERHIYSKRTLYLDEDSWGAAVVDQYDGRGELWRVSMAYLLNNYDLPTTWTGLDVFHDLQARRYHVQGMANEERNYVDFSRPIPDDKYFKPSTLRRRSYR